MVIGHYQRHDLVHYIAVRVLEDALVIDGEALLEDAVGVGVLLVEGQVCHQAHLIAGESDSLVGLHKRLRQGLLEDRELVDQTLESVTAERHRARDAF